MEGWKVGKVGKVGKVRKVGEVGKARKVRKVRKRVLPALAVVSICDHMRHATAAPRRPPCLGHNRLYARWSFSGSADLLQ